MEISRVIDGHTEIEFADLGGAEEKLGGALFPSTVNQKSGTKRGIRGGRNCR
jgi:hypothetical protein